MENDQFLSKQQISDLTDCLTVTKMAVHTFHEIDHFFQQAYGKHYFEEHEPTPVQHYERNPTTGEFKVDKMREFAPKLIASEEYAKMTQKEKNEYLKN